MNSQDNVRALAWGAVIGSVFLAVGLITGLGMAREVPPSAAPSATAAAASGNVTAPTSGLSANMLPVTTESDTSALGGATSSAGTNADAPSTRVRNDVVTFFFASGKSDLAQGAREALGTIVKGVAAGHTAVISTYHEAIGDAAQNEALAQQRATAVRGALISLGIGEDKLQLSSREASAAGSSSGQDIPRVEVRLQ